ncbi:hypothetical protein DBL02_12855 [Acinetobacter oleivorans]|uniref:sce7726 family protein n=1 Tax=Acinetobacter oleivorans TaxID=1148157 RepID=UPI000D3182AD|nr:sce7726 family protein [Acinetobacter oleivorans]PTV44570.1 hypothetical protein DBL02_12855 [Acinetobacter oleivorans]
MSINKMLDKDVRLAVKNKVLKDHINDPSTLVIDELGLDYGRNRIDIAVVNGELHGYELKSDSDTLKRLPSQAICYSAVMDKVTLVVGEKHAKEAIEMVPDWWGIKVAVMGKKGGIHLDTFRRNKKNTQINPMEVLKLIWKEEALELLSNYREVDWKIKKLQKKVIYQLIIDNLSIDEIRNSVRSILKTRVSWRSD